MKIYYKLFVIIVFSLIAYNMSYARGSANAIEKKVLRDIKQNQDKYNHLAQEQTRKIEHDVNHKVNNKLSNLPKQYREDLNKNQENFNKERDEALQDAYKQSQAIQNDVNKTIKSSYRKFGL